MEQLSMMIQCESNTSGFYPEVFVPIFDLEEELPQEDTEEDPQEDEEDDEEEDEEEDPQEDPQEVPQEETFMLIKCEANTSGFYPEVYVPIFN